MNTHFLSGKTILKNLAETLAEFSTGKPAVFLFTFWIASLIGAAFPNHYYFIYLTGAVIGMVVFFGIFIYKMITKNSKA